MRSLAPLKGAGLHQIRLIDTSILMFLVPYIFPNHLFVSTDGIDSEGDRPSSDPCANRVVFGPRFTDGRSGLDERLERPPGSNGRSKNAVEAFVVGVLPRATRIDVARCHRTHRQSALDAIGNELGSVVAAQTYRAAGVLHQLGQHPHDIDGRQVPCAANRQALARELVDHRQTLLRPTIDRLILDEVAAPDTVRMLGAMHPLRAMPRHLAGTLLLANL